MALDFIHKNYDKDISISDIASEININRSHLFKFFKYNYNPSAISYKLQIK